MSTIYKKPEQLGKTKDNLKISNMSKEEIQALISTGEVEKLMLNIRGKNVLLDRDVATLYGVETRIVNQAVKNNPEKFPFGYIFELDKYETQQLIENREQFAVKKIDRKIPLP